MHNLGYTYDQTYKRVTQISRYYSVNGTEDTAERVNFYYDTNPFDSTGFSQYTAGRLAAVQYGYQNGMYDWYSYTQAGSAAAKRLQVNEWSPNSTSMLVNFDALYTYDNEGRRLSVTYPSTYPSGTGGAAQAGPSYAYGYDVLGRPITMTDQSTNIQQVNGVTYGTANELKNISYYGVSEVRGYNYPLIQLNSISAAGITMTYSFPSAPSNNGKINSQYDSISGETVSYTYDSLNRMIGASSTGGWGEGYTFDPFGNLLDKTVTAGSAPSLSVTVNQATNQLNGTTYDANGNNTAGGAYLYDIENRLNELPAQGGGIAYGYDARNKRIWSENYSSNNAQLVYFYGVDGRKLATYSLMVTGGGGLAYQFATSTASMQVYFAGKLVAQGFGASISPYVQDRLGSMRYNGAYNYPVNYPAYYPYGEDKGTAAPNDQIKFATYTRDLASGLDYADQRYYSNQFGRFMTPDSYGDDNWDLSDPQSWNLYAYTEGDPVNFNDPDGTVACGDLQILGTGSSLRSAVTGQGDTALLADLVWAESDPTWSRLGTPAWFNEQDAIAWSVINRRRILDGYLSVAGVSNPSTLGWGPNGATLSQVIGQPGQYSTISGGPSNPHLRSDLQSSLNSVLSGSPSASDSLTFNFGGTLGTVVMTNECYDVWQSWVTANNALSAVPGVSSDPFASQGYTTSFHYGTLTTRLEGYFGNFGDANNFFGIVKSSVTVNPTPVLPRPRPHPVGKRPKQRGRRGPL